MHGQNISTPRLLTASPEEGLHAFVRQHPVTDGVGRADPGSIDAILVDLKLARCGFLVPTAETDHVQLMQRQIHVLRQLVLDCRYTVDEAAVADAIIARVMARRAVNGAAFRNDIHPPQTRACTPAIGGDPSRRAT